MKRNLLVILAVLTLFYVSCKKDSANTTPSSADSYFPVTSGSTWRYYDFVQGSSTDTITLKMTGGTSIFNNKTYYNTATKSTNSGAGTEYFYSANHSYAIRALNAYAGTIIELKLYNDTATVGNNLISTPTDNGLVDVIPARTINTVVAKNLTRTINGKTFTDVIHTKVDFQYDYSGNYQTGFSYDFYLAKGIGMIESQLTILGGTYEEEVILDYSIK